MQNSEEHLDVDLSFLDEQAGPTGTSAVLDTGYKVNWRNIAVIVGIVAFGGYLLFASDRQSSQARPNSAAPGYEAQSSVSDNGSTNTAPADQSQSPVTSDNVTVGQFRCSSEAAAEADRLAPTENQSQLESEKDALDARASQLQQLKAQINSDPVDENSSQADIDYHNQMIDSYNSQLNSFRSEATSFQEMRDTFNAQVEAHNNYLVQHCTRRGQ